jgi:hypothetical protein
VGPVRLEVQLRQGGSVVATLINGSRENLRFYDSLTRLRGDEVPDLTTIRLRGPQGEIFAPWLADKEGYWSKSISLVRTVPVILDQIPAGSSREGTTRVATLLQGYPDPEALRVATHAQIRCTVFLEKGVVHGESRWFALSDQDKALAFNVRL